MIHPQDAELMYDGPLPAHVRAGLDANAPRRFLAEDHATPDANAVRLTPKPAAVLARMVRVMAAYAERGGLTEQDLGRAGFTDAEIAAHGTEALRQMLLRCPGLASLEFAA